MAITSPTLSGSEKEQAEVQRRRGLYVAAACLRRAERRRQASRVPVYSVSTQAGRCSECEQRARQHAIRQGEEANRAGL